MNNLPECKYRRFSRRPGLLRLHCFLKRADCSYEECESCFYATSLPESIEMMIGDEIVRGAYSEMPDTNRLAFSNESMGNWLVDHEDTKRLDLQSLRVYASRSKSKKARKFTVEADGVLVYEQKENDWEPPRDVNGYQRDPENQWRFIPLWPKCSRRHPTGTRNKNCGGIQITMYCQHPQSELNGAKVTHEQCQQCPLRED